MKRLLALLLLLCLLSVPVYGAEVRSWDVEAAVTDTGEVAMAVELVVRLEEPVNELVFPLGSGAKKLTVNGVSMKIKKVDGLPCAVLQSETGFSGTLKFHLNYTLRKTLDTKGQWDLVLPLLAEGSPYPVQQVSFRVTLPGEAKLPTFHSGYQGADVDNYMNISLDGNVISGTVDTTLRDHENLVLTMETDPLVFPRVGQTAKLGLWCSLGAAAAWMLGLLYWFFFLRWKPFRTVKQTSIPVGITCGQIGSQLLTQRPDTALTIISWAQAGYITIHMNRDQAVTLHKRMDMGSERSRRECKLFQKIFGKSRTAEVSTHNFQLIREKADQALPPVGKLFQGRGLPVLARIFSGISGGLLWAVMGNSLLSSGIIRIIITVLAGIIGFAASWLLQKGWQSFFSWDKKPLLLSLGAAGATVALGIVSGRIGVSVFVLLGQGVVGFLLVFGGRRSQTGRSVVQTILSFQKYLRFFGAKRVNRMIRMDPGYYYQIAPYALALGVDKHLAKSFAKVELPECPWLITDGLQTRHSLQWYLLLRKVTGSIRG